MLSLAFVLLVGCETRRQPSPQSPPQQQQPAPSQPQPKQQEQPAPSQPKQQQEPAPSQPSPSPQQPAANPPATPAPPMEQKKAEVGVGKKGRGYGQGVIATPAATLFAAKERLIFEDLIPHAMDIFKATEDRAPKTHEEFMEKIIKANDIRLPALPPGHSYKYDPAQSQLMVEQ
jgi:hypothetical protein